MYLHDTGYSNYTVMGKDARCAINRNEYLKKNAEVPDDWSIYGWGGDRNNVDNWAATANAMCDCWIPRPEGDDILRFDVEENAPLGNVPPGWSRVVWHAIKKDTGY